jgi:chromatin segregation and condensation protein Rec8/ScpA/Scc1 (kleisin family)
VVIHFLALLELYKRDLVEIEQAAAFSRIGVRWLGGSGADLGGPIDLTVEEPA